MACINFLGCCLGNPSTPSLIEGEEVEFYEKDLGDESDEGANYQQDLWQSVLQRKLYKSSRYPNQLMTIPAGSNFTAEAFLQNLTTAYNQNGFAQKVPRIREIFQNIDPFISAINTMVQANSVASLVWGSVTLVFQVKLRLP